MAAERDVIEPAHGQGEHVCPECGKAFASHIRMVAHQNGKHRQEEYVSGERPPKQDRAPRARVSRSNLEEQVASLHVVGALTAQMFGYHQTAAALMAQAPMCAKALVGWSEASPMVRRALEGLVGVGGAAAVAAAYGPVIATFAAEVQQRRLMRVTVEENGQVPPPEEPYPGTGEPAAEPFAYVAPDGANGASATY